MSYYKKIDGDFVYLASINLNDADKYMEWVNCSSDNAQIVFGGYTGKTIESEEQAREQLNDMAVKNVFAIIDKSTNQFIGLTGFSNTQAMNQRSGIWIKMDTNLDYEKQVAQGAEALDFMLEYGFDIMNLNSIVMDVPVFNQQALDICNASQMNFMAERHASSKFSDDKFYNTVSFQCSKNLYGRKTDISDLILDRSGKTITGLAVDESNLGKVLNGENITLSKYQGQEDYVPRMASFLNDPLVSIPLGEYKTNWNDYRAKKQLESVDYVIEKDGILIGYVNLFRKDMYNRTADLEIMIGDRSQQRKGYGTEAMELLLAEEYQNGPFNSLVSNVFEFNEASHKLHEDVGYQKIGVRNQGYYAYGKLNDMHTYEMNRDLYQKHAVKEKTR